LKSILEVLGLKDMSEELKPKDPVQFPARDLEIGSNKRIQNQNRKNFRDRRVIVY